MSRNPAKPKAIERAEGRSLRVKSGRSTAAASKPSRTPARPRTASAGRTRAPTKRTTYHHGNLREALIAAAVRELTVVGVAGFSLRNVARRAGASAPAVYRHFEDKDALLGAVAADGASRLATAMVAATTNAPDDPLERFRAIGIALVQFAVAHPEHFRVQSLPGLVERTPPELAAREAAWKAHERASLLAAQAQGLISEVPIDDLLLTANCAVMGLAHAIVEGRLGVVSPARATELAIQVTEVLGCGLAPRTSRRC